MGKRGFTLIELLTVLVILPILMMIAYPAIRSYLDKSEKTYYADMEASLESSAMDFVADHNEYLPKVLGEYRKLEVQIMVDAKEIEQVTTKDGKPCESSYVAIQKKGVGEYQYTTCLVCGTYQSKEEACKKNIH